MNDLLTRLWRLGKPLQWRFLWLVHGGLDGLVLDPLEVLEARLFNPGELPDGMPEGHRELIASL